MVDDGRPDVSPAVAHLRVELEHTMKRYNNALMWIDMAKACRGKSCPGTERL
jgi:hypothetical protein